ncbi:hypothetical protein IFM89_000633 [Coptis chinensis]|uniref:Pentatricopeptide repeat-containing protein n=1 Tax=Coptis chinensis TaxID=261450 RepID=A0A835HAQ4_9MAGN|nr:hypothetical protein IFM89_000633 [Coptis chinensis]
MLRAALKHAKSAASHFHQPFFTTSSLNSIITRTYISTRGCVRLGNDEFWHQRNTFQQQRMGFVNELEDKIDPVAKQMIEYGINLARKDKTSDSYAQGLLVLEQCLSSAGDENTKGVVLLAMSTLLSERGDLNDGMEKLKEIRMLGSSHLGVRVAAVEGLIGLSLEKGQDGVALLIADTCSELLKPNSEDVRTLSNEFQGFLVRANAIRGLVEVLRGKVEIARKCFEEIPDHKYSLGNVMLLRGEFLHATGNFALAKGYYQKAIEASSETDSFSDLDTLAACNLVPMEVRLGVTCALGQLEAHSWNFNDAEEILTKALTKAEEDFGGGRSNLHCSHVPIKSKTGALELSIDSRGAESKVERSDIVALARESPNHYSQLVVSWCLIVILRVIDSKHACFRSTSVTPCTKVKRNIILTDTVQTWTGVRNMDMENRVVELFEKMRNMGIKQDHSTFLSVLTACSHVGLLDRGLHYFDLMRDGSVEPPKMEHYACIVDLLGRAGNLDEAERFISNMPMKPGSSVYKALLS